MHVTLRAPKPKPPADGLSDEQVLDRLAPGAKLVLGDDGTWRVVEPE